MTDFALDRRALARSFNQAAPHYDSVASLQRRSAVELLDRLQFFALDPECIVDLGAGTGQGALALRGRYGRALVLAIDLAEGMLRAMPRSQGFWARPWLWRPRLGRPRLGRPRWGRPAQRGGIARVCADAYALPLADQSVGLIYSNLMLQWCDQPDRVFSEIARVLRPDGLLVFSSFGPDTLRELRAAWAAADQHSHVSLFADMPQLAEGLMRAGLAEPVMDVEQYRQYYPDAQALMRELKRLGARNAARDRARGLTGRSRLRLMLDAYEAQRTAQGLPATYEIVFGAAFGGGRSPSGPGRGRAVPEEVAVPVAALGRTRR